MIEMLHMDIDARCNEAQGIMMHYELRSVMEFSLEYVD